MNAMNVAFAANAASNSDGLVEVQKWFFVTGVGIVAFTAFIMIAYKLWRKWNGVPFCNNDPMI